MVPQPGGSVLVLNGPYRGTKGMLQSIDTKRFQVGQGRAGQGGAAGDEGGLPKLLWARRLHGKGMHFMDWPCCHTAHPAPLVSGHPSGFNAPSRLPPTNRRR